MSNEESFVWLFLQALWESRCVLVPLCLFILALLLLAFGVWMAMWWGAHHILHELSKWWHEGYERSEDE